MANRNREFTIGFNAFVIGQTGFQCPFKQKQQILDWQEGFVAAKRRRAIRCL